MSKQREKLITGLLLVGIVWITYAQVLYFKCAFIDDLQSIDVISKYITSAPAPQETTGINAYRIIGTKSTRTLGDSLRNALPLDTCPGLHWAIIPLPLLSAMIEAKLFSMAPITGFVSHLTNLCLHTFCVLMLFFVLRASTGRQWQSAFVAALFAVHPASNIPVSVLCMRTYSFSTLFYLMATGMYLLYVRRPSVKKYGILLGLWIVSISCHPTALHLPLILLLYDYWPLNRIATGKTAMATIKENLILKLPFFLFFLLVSGITVIHLIRKTSILHGLLVMDGLFFKKFLIIPIYYIEYLQKIIWPSPRQLSIVYADSIPWGAFFASCLILIVITGVVLWQARRRRYLLVGWFWYIIALSPSILDLILTTKPITERYLYLPAVGVFIMIAWAGGEVVGRLRHGKTLGVIISGAVIVILMITSGRQTRCWKDMEHFFKITAEVRAPNHPMAHRNLGVFLLYENKIPEAIAAFNHALSIDPQYAEAHYWLGVALAENHEPEKALSHYRHALQLNSDSVRTLNNIANLLADMGKREAAIAYYEQALKIAPEEFRIHNNLATALMQNGQQEAAIAHLQKALELKPDYEHARENLAAILAGRHMSGESR